MHASPTTSPPGSFLRGLGPLLAAIALSALCPSAATANPYGDPRGWLALFEEPAVLEELALGEAERAAARRILGESASNLKQARGAARKLLTDAQWKRLRQLHWQREGGYALLDETVAEHLELTGEQQKRLQAAVEVNLAEHKKMRDFLARARFRSREAMQKYIDGYRQKADARLMEVLTDAQRAKLKTLLGKPLASAGGATESP